MSSEWEISELGKEAINASRAFSFKQHPKAVFINTGDVLRGRFLHRTLSESEGLPGQAKKALKKNDILLTEIRPGNGRYAYVDFDTSNYVVSTKFMVIESLGRVRSRFLYHVLTNQAALDELQRIAESRSGTFPQITFDSIAHFPVPVPSDSEQDKLVEFFDTLDDRITLLRETNATLEAIAQALFKSWFVDFDPVRAKMEGRTPEGMDEATAALFPDGLEMSELGEVPRGWRVMPFSTIVSVTSGKRPEDRADSPSSTIAVPLYGGAGVMGYTSSSLFDVPKILTGRVGTLGKVQIAYPPFWASDNVLVVTPKNQLFFSFAYHWLRLIDVAALNRGSTQPLLTQRDLCAQKGVVPPSQTLEAFEGVATSLNARILANAKQAENLSILRDTLLPRLISGQLRLPEAQAATEAALGGTLSV